MSDRFVLARAGGLCLEVDEPVIDAESLPTLGSAVELLRRLEGLRSDLLRRGRERFERARREGLAQGRAEGERAASEQVLGALNTLESVLAAERAHQAERVVELALAVVARIAPELGDVAVVTALARRALADLETDQPVRLRVHPEVARALPGAAEGAARSPMLEVVGDPLLGRFDCELDTQEGIIEASLEVQLNALRAVLAPKAEPAA